MREKTAEGEEEESGSAQSEEERRWGIARSVVDDASRLLSGPGLFARRTDRWAIVLRWLQHVRGCLKYRDRGGPLSLCPLFAHRSLLYEACSRRRAAAEAARPGPQRHTRKGGHLCPSLIPVSRTSRWGEYGPRLMGSSRIVVPIPRFPPFTVPFSFVFSYLAERVRLYVCPKRCQQSEFSLCLSCSGTSITNYGLT